MNKADKATTSLEVFAHWSKPTTGEATIAGHGFPYTILTVYQPTEKEGRVDPKKVFLLGSHLEALPDHTPLLLVLHRVSGEPLALRLRSAEEDDLLWEKPAQDLAPWITIYEDNLTVKGPSDCTSASVIAISHWSGDDFYHLYVPPPLTSTVESLLEEWNPDKVSTHRTEFREYDVLYVSWESGELPPFRSLLEQGVPNAVFLEHWD
jgi:hypothetical protein